MASRSYAEDADCSAARRRYHRLLAIEAVLGMIGTSAIGCSVAWVMFHSRAQAPWWGGGGLVFDALPSTFGPMLLMVPTLTWVARRRRRTGVFNGCEGLAPRWVAVLPEPMVVRTLVMALIAAAVSVAVFMLLAAGAREVPATFREVMSLKLAQNILLGAIAAPIIVARTLAEPESAKS